MGFDWSHVTPGISTNTHTPLFSSPIAFDKHSAQISWHRRQGLQPMSDRVRNSESGRLNQVVTGLWLAYLGVRWFGSDDMEKKTAKDFDQELLYLFDQYVHGGIDRRAFLDRAAKFAVGGVTAAMLLDALSPKFAEAQVVAKDDPRLKAEMLEYPSPQGSGTMKGYLVRPAKARREAAGYPGRARESRAQPAHRGRRAPPGAREFRDLRARCPDAARRISRRGRRRRAGALRQTGPGEDARRHAGGGEPG